MLVKGPQKREYMMEFSNASVTKCKQQTCSFCVYLDIKHNFSPMEWPQYFPVSPHSCCMHMWTCKSINRYGECLLMARSDPVPVRCCESKKKKKKSTDKLRYLLCIGTGDTDVTIILWTCLMNDTWTFSPMNSLYQNLLFAKSPKIVIY